LGKSNLTPGTLFFSFFVFENPDFCNTSDIMAKSKKIKVEDFDIALYGKGKDDFFSLTNYVIQNWMRTRNAIEFNGLWEQLNNPDFKSIEFDAFKNEAGANSFTLMEWDLHRTLSKINYRIHTDAIKETLIPPSITKEQVATMYANEADILNVALFGKTAKQ
jgi:hypothetical protein